ncbi:von Willebrand factor type A domain-containing protein [Rhizobium sullae]|uniref:von Willebrand factor type A domain-containing protein n=1 Tax=Rhizobium sullae TaxID=50338 RepID=A0A4R3PV48_RHISU|nr:von Willebrand factor type A domain-containing protein [Rhizobium sullae]
MYQLDLPWMLLILPLPLLIWWLMPPHRETSALIPPSVLRRSRNSRRHRADRSSVVPKRSWPQAIIDMLAWCLIVLALAQPQYVERPLQRTEPQRDILLALDLSQSMDTKDFAAPDGIMQARVDAVRAVVSDFVAKRPGDRLGLMAFGDAPYPLAPFTMDHALVKTLVEGLLPGIAGPRTALGDSLGLAIRKFDKTTVPQKVLIMLTDGNDTASKMPPLKTAEIAGSKGLPPVFTVTSAKVRAHSNSRAIRCAPGLPPRPRLMSAMSRSSWPCKRRNDPQMPAPARPIPRQLDESGRVVAAPPLPHLSDLGAVSGALCDARKINFLARDISDDLQRTAEGFDIIA